MSAVEATPIEALLPHSRWMERMARRLIAESAADDAVQEAWRIALERGPIAPRDPRGWLAKVLRRAARHIRRGERRRMERERVAARSELQPCTLEIVERFATQQVVAGAVLALEPADRDVLLQRFYMELTLREIAARQGVSIATAQERVTRALGRLRGELERRLGVRGERFVLALTPFLGPSRKAWRPAFSPAVILAAVGAAAVLVAFMWHEAERPTSESPSVVGSTPIGAGGDLPGGMEIDVRGELAREPSRTPARIDTSVRPAALQVRVVGCAGEAVAVVLSPAPGFLPEDGARAALARGSVSFEDVPPGPWRVETDRGGLLEVTLAPDAVEQVQLELDGGPPLAGIVLDSRGMPVPFAEVWLSPSTASGDGVTRSLVDDVPSLRADGHGVFRTASTGAARTVGARARGFAPSPEVLLDGSGEQVLVLPGPGGAIAGLVRDQNGIPLAGARLYLDAGGDAAPLVRTRADEVGGFRFDAVAPGERRLLVCVRGAAVRSETVRVAAGEVVELDLVPGRGFSLAGRVTDEAGHPCAGALVFAARRPWTMLPDERFGVLTRSDADGRYRLACIAPHAAWIVADAGAGRRADHLVRADDGAVLRQDFTLPRGPTLVGRIIDEAGRGIEGCEVRVVVPDEWPPRRTTTARDGRFAMPVESELPHRILIEERGVRLARETLASHRDGELSLCLADAERPMAALAGVVVDAAGAPLQRFELRLSDADGRERRLNALGDGLGCFRAADLLPGEIRITITAPGHAPWRLEQAIVLTAHGTADLGTIELEPAPGAATALSR